MASTQANAFFQNLYLTPEQEKALMQALAPPQNTNSLSPPTSNSLSLSPSSFDGSPQQKGDMNSFQESPYLDNYDYSFGDSSYDFDVSDATAQMIGDLPGTIKSESTENEGSEKEKRAHPDDEDDEASNAGAKRRESTEKVPKKPGRKPLTSEPTSKRKAQNRAAQRAFRERKEKHLKDLETKVVELEKKTETATSENTQLRAQLEAVTAELNEYKRKMQAMGNGRSISTGRVNTGFGHAAINNLGDVNFQFEFPKFGVLPGPSGSTNAKPARQTSSSSAPQAGSIAVNSSQQGSEVRTAAGASPSSVGSLSTSELATFSAVFASGQNGARRMNGSASRPSLDSGHYSVGAAATSSPSASSNSNMGPSSSCGTSPEPYNQSPLGFKPLDTMTTIGEEPASLTTGNLQTLNQFDGMDVSGGFDWLAQQNGGQFDPQLFGGYREPQEHILATANFDDLFTDLDADFLTPYNIPATQAAAMPKKSLIAEIDAKQNADDELSPKVKNEKFNCTQMWEQLQKCPKVKSGDLDLDGLCSELQKKAKCSGTGPMVKDQDFTAILKKYLGEDLSKACLESKEKPMIP